MKQEKNRKSTAAVQQYKMTCLGGGLCSPSASSLLCDHSSTVLKSYIFTAMILTSQQAEHFLRKIMQNTIGY